MPPPTCKQCHRKFSPSYPHSAYCGACLAVRKREAKRERVIKEQPQTRGQNRNRSKKKRGQPSVHRLLGRLQGAIQKDDSAQVHDLEVQLDRLILGARFDS